MVAFAVGLLCTTVHQQHSSTLLRQLCSCRWAH